MFLNQFLTTNNSLNAQSNVTIQSLEDAKRILENTHFQKSCIRSQKNKISSGTFSILSTADDVSTGYILTKIFTKIKQRIKAHNFNKQKEQTIKI